MKGVALLEQARSLAEISVDELEVSLRNYTTENDLAVLRVGYVLCRRRREMGKCDLIASRIRMLEREQPWTKRIN